MYKASKGGNVSEVCKALEMKGVDVNENGFKGQTPLWIACLRNNIEVVKILLQRTDLRVNQAKDNGFTACTL